MSVWGYLAANVTDARKGVAFWSLWAGGWAAAFTRAWEILRDEDQPDIKEQP